MKRFKKQMLFFLLVLTIIPCLPYGLLKSEAETIIDYRSFLSDINKPTAQFRLTNTRTNQSVNSPRGKTITAPPRQNAPTLEARVGDVIRFDDLSSPSDSKYRIIEWDWQVYDGKKWDAKYLKSPPPTTFVVDKPGLWSFYLNVRDSNPAVVYKGKAIGAWSDNGNHTVLSGYNTALGARMQWYFTQVNINVVDITPEADFKIYYVSGGNKKNVTDNVNNPIEVKSLPFTVRIEGEAKTGGTVEQWEYQFWGNDRWNYLSDLKDFNTSVPYTTRRYRLRIKQGGKWSEWVEHSVHARLEGQPPTTPTPPQEPDPLPENPEPKEPEGDWNWFGWEFFIGESFDDSQTLKEVWYTKEEYEGNKPLRIPLTVEYNEEIKRTVDGTVEKLVTGDFSFHGIRLRVMMPRENNPSSLEEIYSYDYVELPFSKTYYYSGGRYYKVRYDTQYVDVTPKRANSNGLVEIVANNLRLKYWDGKYTDDGRPWYAYPSPFHREPFNRDIGPTERKVRVQFRILPNPPQALLDHGPEFKYATLPVDISAQGLDETHNIIWNELKIFHVPTNSLVYKRTHEQRQTPVITLNSAYVSDHNLKEISPNKIEGNIIFLQEGNYRAEFTVRNDADTPDGLGLSDTISRTFYVNYPPTPPVADFEMPEEVWSSASFTVNCTSTDINNDIVKWFWTQPEDAMGILDGPTNSLIIFGEGEYEITLQVEDRMGLKSLNTARKTIRVIPPIPEAKITVSGTLKQNRHVILDAKESVSPYIDPIDNIQWWIIPLDGQGANAIRVDFETSTDDTRNVLFKEPGRYKVILQTDNYYSLNVANESTSGYEKRIAEKIIDIAPDEPPLAELQTTNASPSFRIHGYSTSVTIKDASYSPDGDIIVHTEMDIWRDSNNDGIADEKIASFNKGGGELNINVDFQEGIKGMYKGRLFIREEFGQPTIKKFVTAADRRTSLDERIFYINWIPDIDFTLPEWAYTDDVLVIDDVVIRDEVEATTSVVWELKRARETNPSIMDKVNINAFTENTLGKYGGAVRFKESGYYELIATITDEIGQTFSYGQNIRVYPLPTAIIYDLPQYRFHNPFEAKQNRRYTIHGDHSSIHDYYGPGMHQIDRSKDYWEIIALDGQNINEALRIRNGTPSGLQNEISDNTKFVAYNRKLENDLLFRLPGRYLIRYQVTNTHGKKSPVTEEIITVHEDLLPTGDFMVINPTYRDPHDGTRATLTAYSITASSPDEDIIDLRRVRYRFDSNNNGSFDDETWSAPIPIVDNKVVIKVPKVGKYEIELLVRERYGQETLDEFVTASDRREYYVYKTIEVDNIRPVVDFKVSPLNKVDIVFTIGEIEPSKILELNTKINTYVRTYLEANNADLIDTRIETVDTGSIEVVSANPQEVLATWRKWGQSANWVVDGATNAIMDPQYHCAQAGYADTRPETRLRDFTFTYDIMGRTHRYGDNMGVTFRMRDAANYYALMWRYASSCGAWFTTEQGGSVTLTLGGIDLIKVTNGIPTVVATSMIGQWADNVWYSFEIEAYGPTIKVNHKGNTIINYTDTNNPILEGNIGVAAVSHAPSYWRNLKIETSTIKTLDEALRDTTWRENSTRFVVNLSDVELPELNTASEKYPVVLSRMLSDNLYFAQLGTTKNRTQAQNFIAHNSGKGIHIRNDQPNMDKALQDLAQYILSVVRSQARTDVKYVLLNEDVNYQVIYTDYENDPNFNLDNWKYEHDHLYFENTLGRVNYHDLWLTESIDRFDKVGKFVIEHRTKDNPVGSDNRFDEYRKWSEMINGPTTLYVHRKPFAIFTGNIQKLANAFRVTFTDSSYDLDHQSKPNQGIARWEWSWKTDTDTTWNTRTFSTRQAGITWINGQFNSRPLNNNYLVRLRVQDIDGENGLGAWSDEKIMLISNIGMPPIAQFTVNPAVLPINESISIQDNSYDPNGDPIVEWRWVLTKTSGGNLGTWNFNYNNTFPSETFNASINSRIQAQGIGDYRLTLQVRDNTGPWGDPISTSGIYTQNFRVIPVNKPPEAGFNLQTGQSPTWTFPRTVGNMTMNARPSAKTFFIEELVNWNEWARDPDGHAMQYQWTLERYRVPNISDMGSDPNPEIKTYNGSLAASSPVATYNNFRPFSGSFQSQGLGYGAYRVVLRVNDLPPVPPYMPTDRRTIFVSDTYYIIPDISFIVPPSYEHDGDEIVVGDTIKVRAVTSREVTSVFAVFGGKNVPLNQVSSNVNSITWAGEFKVPETITESGTYNLVIRAHTNYGGNGTNTRTISHSIPLDIIALKLVDFRIHNIVNHPYLSFPKYKDEFTIEYQAGYNVTFRIDAYGNPEEVKAKIYHNSLDNLHREVKLTKVQDITSNHSIWEGRYFAPARTDIGTIIRFYLSAKKNTTTYDYNQREGNWNGNTLEVVGSGLKDGRINRIR